MKINFASYVIVCALLSLSASEADSPKPVFPEIQGWTMTADKTVYTTENLWNIIDGAADLFLEYNFVDLHIGRYLKSADMEIKVELYQHKTSEDAFGIYSQERYNDYHFINLGVQGYIEKGALNFLTGSYYVKISTLQSGSEAQDALLMIAKKLEEHLRQNNSWPSLLRAFPSAGKQPNSEQYIAKNFLGYSFLNGAYVASYDGENSFKAFIIRWDTPNKASDVVAEYLKVLPRDSVTVGKGGRYRARDPHNGTVDFVLDGRSLYGMYVGDERKADEGFLTSLGTSLSKIK
jgi:hypothetical protein